MQFMGVPHHMNHPHSLANPKEQGTKETMVKNTNKTA